MRHRPLGKSGISASVVGLGTWAIGGWMWGGTEKNDAVKAIQAGLDAGINLVDTAPMYGFGVSEEIVGQAIAGRRDKVVLATKCGLVSTATGGDFFFNSGEESIGVGNQTRAVYRFLGPDMIRWEVEESLRRLKTDVIDLYQTHWQESKTPIADTMAALEKLREQGKIRAIGVSNATPEQMDEYRRVGVVDVDQEKYSMLDRGREQTNLAYCKNHKIAFLAYSPLELGLLTGKVGPDRTFDATDQRSRNPRFSVENRQKVATMLAAMKPVADVHQASPAQVVIAWTLEQPGCSHTLVGARNPAQALENAKAGDLKLTAAELKQVTAALKRYEAAAK